jgi:hypothetical protein
MGWLRSIEWQFESAIFDGEACAGDGHEGIQALFDERNRVGGDMALVLFDVLHLDGKSVMKEPWCDRPRPLSPGPSGCRSMGTRYTSATSGWRRDDCRDNSDHAIHVGQQRAT